MSTAGTATGQTVTSSVDYSSPAIANPGTPAYDPIILGHSGKASDMAATLTRATWDDYVKRFKPESDALIASTGFMNPGTYNAQVGAGIGQVNRAFDAALGSKATALSRYGLGMTSEQQAYNNMQDNVARSASIVDAANRIRQRIKARDMNIALGGTGS